MIGCTWTDWICTPCDYSCESCSTTPTFCETCDETGRRTLDNNTCPCDDGYFEVTERGREAYCVDECSY
jgi:hypothetical protein